MKDIFGTEICIGDIVAINPASYKGLLKGKVRGISEKTVAVEYVNHVNYAKIKHEYPFNVVVDTTSRNK